MKAVCVNSTNTPGMKWTGDAPVVGRVYTVNCVLTDDNGDTVLHLKELDRSRAAKRQHGPLVGYFAHRFRPLDEDVLGELLCRARSEGGVLEVTREQEVGVPAEAATKSNQSA